MSTISEARGRVRAKVWQSLAQTDLNLSALPRADLETLVDTVVDAALVGLDETLAEIEPAEPQEPVVEGGEQVLWQGRPFLSISTRYLITDERVRIVTGLLGKDRQDIELVRVQDIDLEQTVRERLLNLGDIKISSHDPSHPEVTLNNVKDPEEVHETLRRAVQDARKRFGLIYREEM
ncbi:MAG: PH domain-containing protein [Candidatus Promineifilaceae bacterium]